MVGARGGRLGDEEVIDEELPADINGDGFKDVVFTSFDHNLYAVDRAGNPIFPKFNNADTIFSSPAVFDSDRDGRPEIYFGGDASDQSGQFEGCRLGVLRRVNPDGSAGWHRCFDTIFQSSGAIGDIDGDGRPEMVIGGGLGGGSQASQVQAVHLDDGSDVPGWPVTLNSPSLVSPPCVG